MTTTQNLRDLIDAASAEHPQHARMADIELDELTKQLAALRSENEVRRKLDENMQAQKKLILKELYDTQRQLAQATAQWGRDNEKLGEEVRAQYEVTRDLTRRLAQARETLEKAHNQAARSKCLNCSEVFYILEATLRSPAAESAASEPVPQDEKEQQKERK